MLVVKCTTREGEKTLFNECEELVGICTASVLCACPLRGLISNLFTFISHVLSGYKWPCTATTVTRSSPHAHMALYVLNALYVHVLAAP